MRFRLLLESYKVALRDSPIIRSNFSQDVIERTVEIVKETHFNPEQVVYR